MRASFILLIILVLASSAPAAEKWYLDKDRMNEPAYREMVEIAQSRAKFMDEYAIPELVEMLLSSQVNREDYLTLCMLEERAVPAMVEALSDPRFHELEEIAPNVRAASRLGRLWDQMEPYAPAAAIEPLTMLASHEKREVRQSAALALGSIGRVEAIEPLKKCLADPEFFVREYALMGLRRAIASRRAAPKLLADLFDPVSALVDMKPSIIGTEAPLVLLSLDRGKAIAFLADAKRIRPDHPQIASIVKALSLARAVMPGERILPVVDALERQTPPEFSAYGHALVLLALAGDPSSAARIEKAMSHEDRRLRSLASDAYLALNGVSHAYDVWNLGLSDSNSPEPVRYFVAVSNLNYEIMSGGLSWYFYNSTGDGIADALAGLKAIGAIHSEKILQETVLLFGEKGPALDRETRHQQLNTIDKQRLEDLSKAFLADPDHLEVLLARYAVKHKEHFRALQPGTKPSE
jgi:HEAT repeat protein